MFYDDGFWIMLAIYLLLTPLTAIVLSGWAMRRSSLLRTEVARLRVAVDLAERGATRPARPQDTTAAPDAENEIEEEEPSIEPVEPASAEKSSDIEDVAPILPEDDEPAVKASPFAPAPPRLGWEQRLASRWMLWLGGIALALGGGFLVKVSLDMGLLSPGLRCLLGALLGLALAVGGEVLRRRPFQMKVAEAAPNYLPQALSAAGIAILFASTYAAHGLYGLLAAPIAFMLLGIIAFAGVGLAMLQGPFIAALGLLGGFVTPALIATVKPSALPLFAYLLALTVASLAVSRYRAWNWLAILAIAGANFWAMLWAGAAWRMESAPVFGLYLTALAVAVVWYRYDIVSPWPSRTSSPDDTSTHRYPWSGLDLLVCGSFAGLLLNAFFFARLDHYGVASLATLGVLVSWGLLQGRRVPSLSAFPLLAALAVTATLAAWHLPQFVPGPEPLIVLEAGPVAHPRAPIVPPELVAFVGVSVAFAILFATAAFLLMTGARRPGAWASLSAGVPIAILVIAYWRIADFQTSLSWAGISLLLAAAAVAAAVRSERGGDPMRGALGAYAVAVVAAVALAATMELREAWLTVALAALLPAIAWIERHLDLRALRATAGVLALVVIGRLLFNQTLLSGSPVGQPLFNWILYGYGLPALFFLAASRLFDGRGQDRLVALLEAGTVLFVTLLVTFEIRSFFNDGRVGASSFDLAEQSTQILGWLGLALGLFWINRHRRDVILLWSWRALGALAVLAIALGPLTFGNPLWSGAEVGDWHVLNLLALAYLAPAALLSVALWLLKRTGERVGAMVAGSAILVMIFVWQSLELRHAFHGTSLTSGATSDAEWYAYSLVWLVYAALLLVVGIWHSMTVLRHAGLALLSLVALKVFLFDMGALTGLYRAGSFLGLGVSLIGIGYLYQRFVFPPKAPDGPAENDLLKSG